MSANRFYVPENLPEPGVTFRLPDHIGRQVFRVLRMKPGDSLFLFDGRGIERTGTIANIERSKIQVVIGPNSGSRTEPELEVTVYQALVASERMEFVVQKCTELGVAKIVPIVSQRVQSKDARPGDGKLDRWRRIAVEAAEQSGRTRVPNISAPVVLNQLLSRETRPKPLIVLWEEESGKSLRQAARESLSSDPKRAAVLIGPVGGLSASEVDAVKLAGGLIAGAGPRILRAETAPVVALTALMYEAGELGDETGPRQ